MNFAITPRSVPVKEILTAVEQGISNLPQDAKDEVRGDICNIIKNAKAPNTCNFSQGERQAMKKLKENDSIKKSGNLTEKEYFKIKPSDPVAAAFYRLPKVHKVQLTVKDHHYTLASPSTPIPLRPINSSIGSPTYHVSKYLANLLSPLRSDHGDTIKNSKEFADFVQTQTVRPDEEIVCFDVVSLFTSIPVNLALKVIQSKLETNHTWTDKTKLTKNQIVELTKIVLYNSFFSYEGTLYYQIFGCAMGSPVSVVIADLVMEHVEVQALSTFTAPPAGGSDMLTIQTPV